MLEIENPQSKKANEDKKIHQKNMLPEKYMANYNDSGEITTNPSEYKKDKVSVVNTAKEKIGGTTAAVDLMQSGANKAFNKFAQQTKETEEEKISVAHSLHKQAAAITKEKRTGNIGYNHNFEKNQAALDQIKQKFTPEDKDLWEQYCAFQLKDITETHCWVPAWAWNNIKPKFKAWGLGSNFVGTIGDAEQAINSIRSDVSLLNPQQRINKLENLLGLPTDSWAKDGAEFVEKIYRFTITDPKKLKIKLPEGTEAGANLTKWVAGGKTLGGATEFVISSLTLDDFTLALKEGTIIAKEVNFSEVTCPETIKDSLPG